MWVQIPLFRLVAEATAMLSYYGLKALQRSGFGCDLPWTHQKYDRVALLGHILAITGMWCNGSIHALEAWGDVQIVHFRLRRDEDR